MNSSTHKKIKSEFDKETLRMILKEVAEAGQPFDLIADKYRLPPMFIMDTHDPDELVTYEGQEMTLQQFHDRFPYRKCIVIRGPK